MDIKAVSQPFPVAVGPESASTSMARGPQRQSDALAAGNGTVDLNKAIETVARQMAEAIQALRPDELPGDMMRAEVSVDEDSRRIHARLYNQKTGKLVVEYPAEEVLRLLAAIREQFGPILQTDV